MSFWGELKRRNVFKVGAAYVIVAWLIVQVANTFFTLLSFPKWAAPMVAILVVLGFPLALLFAWAFEMTPEGLKKTEHVPLEESITHITGRKLDFILGGLLIIAVAYILFDNYYLDRRFIEIEVASRVSELAPPAVGEEGTQKSIAVLPFVNLSPDPDQEYFVDGLTEELLNSLAQIPELTVIARTSSFTFKNSEKKIPEIAKELGVAHILEGSVRKSGDALRITAQLVKGLDGAHLWSKTYDRRLKDIFEVQEDIASTVANELKIALGVSKSFTLLGGTENLEAYELYLVAQGQLNEGDNAAYQRALISTEAAIALDRDFALAWAQKALVHELLSITVPPSQTASEYDAGLIAANKAIELEPNLVNAYAVLGGIKSAKGGWIEAELAYKHAIELATGPSAITGTYSQYLYAVGCFKKANRIYQTALQNDPLNVEFHLAYFMSFALLGDKQQVEKEIKLAKALFATQISELELEASMYITQARLGIGDYVTKDEISALFDDSWNVEIDLHFPEKGILELRQFLADNIDLSGGYLNNVALVAANLGDYELAMGIIEKLSAANPKSIFFAWFPIMHEVRRLPRFKELVRKIGLVDYWEQFGWPDLCHPLDNGDFVCD